MAKPDFTIRIDSILGGITAYSDVGRQDQFRMSYSIDPDQNYPNETIASGLLRPAGYEKFSGNNVTGAPLWMTANPKDANVYVYDYLGSVYSFDQSFAVTGLTDLNDGGTAAGNGLTYYDNFLYASRATTVARFGPLDGAAAQTWSDAYWTSAVGGQTLTNTTYPIGTGNSITLPNHPLLRHSDGKLYIADVVDNQGTLHSLKTTKSTYEGDIYESFANNVLDFPTGYWPTAMASYGTDIAVALYEGNTTNTFRQRRAKLSFWDTVNPNTYDKIIDVEFPDPLITALLNSNGILYTFSGQVGLRGTRICRFVGGYSFEQVAFIEEAFPPLQGAVDGFLNRIILGSRITNYTSRGGVVFSVGSKKSAITNEVFSVMGCSGADNAAAVTSVGFFEQVGETNRRMITGWNISGSSGTAFNGLDKQGTASTAYFTSQKYHLGQNFKVTKIRIPLTDVPSANSITPTIYVDNMTTGTALTAINSTNFANKRLITYRPNALTGEHTLQIELKWEDASDVVSLPITIEGEFVTDN